MWTLARGYEDATSGSIPRNSVLWEIAKQFYKLTPYSLTDQQEPNM